jgi:hypothetical protein
MRTGTIDRSDILGTGQYVLADGSIVENTKINFRTLKIGSRILHNVRGAVGGSTGGSGDGSDAGSGATDGGSDNGVGSTQTQPTRFYATVELDPVSASMQFAQVMNEVVQHFTAKYGSKVSISVEVNASHSEGYDEHTQRTVKTNCGVLKFRNYEFGE